MGYCCLSKQSKVPLYVIAQLKILQGADTVALTHDQSEATTEQNSSESTSSKKQPITQFTQLGRFLKQNQRWIVFLLLLVLMVLHTRDIYLIPPESAMPMTWLGYGIGSLITLAVRRYKKEPLSRFLLYSTVVGLTMSANYFLYQTGIWMPSYVVFIAVVGLVLIVDIIQTDHSHVLLKTGIVLLAVALFFSSDYEQYQNRLLKDHRFDHYIRNTFDLQAPLSAEDLQQIEGFYITSYNHISRLDGIEHFTNLNRLTIWESSLIQDLTLVADLPYLQHLRFYEVLLKDVDQMESMGQLTSIRLQRTQFENEALFQQLVQQQGIQLEGLNTQEDTIIHIP